MFKYAHYRNTIYNIKSKKMWAWNFFIQRHRGIRNDVWRKEIIYSIQLGDIKKETYTRYSILESPFIK